MILSTHCRRDFLCGSRIYESRLCRASSRKLHTNTAPGAGDVQVVELPDAIKTVLVRWNKVKFDLADLVRLRWIKKMTLPEICQEIGLGRSAVQVSIRTLRKVGISQLNLTEFEKITVESEIKREVQKFAVEQHRNFNLGEVHESFRVEAV